MSALGQITSAITRLVCIGFVVVVGMTIPEAWKLTNDSSFTYSGTTLYFSLNLCEQRTITINGVVQDLPSYSEGDTCFTFQYFINACVASMFFSGVAVLVLFVCDAISKYCRGPIKRATVVGMSLFLIFILIQMAACNYALYRACKLWEDYYMSYYNMQLEGNGVDDVQAYGDKFFFFLSAIMALATSGLLLLDSIVSLCSASKTKQDPDRIETPASDPEIPKSSSTLNIETNQTQDNYNETNSTEQPVHPKSWTSY